MIGRLAWCVVVSGLLSSGSPTVASELEPIVPKEHKAILQILEKVEKKSPGAYDILLGLRDYPKTERLEAVAYCMNRNRYSDAALSAVFSIRDMEDRRLAPFLAKVIEASQEEKLLGAVSLAYRIPDPVLLPALMDHALDSDYVNVDFSSSGPRGHVSITYFSVFAKTAEALFKITDGKIGIEQVAKHHPVPDERRKKLTDQWRKTWRELQREQRGPTDGR